MGGRRAASSRRVLDWWREDPDARARELFVAAFCSRELAGTPAFPYVVTQHIGSTVLDLAGERRGSRLGFHLFNEPDGAAERVALAATLVWERRDWAARSGGDSAWVVLLPAGEVLLAGA